MQETEESGRSQTKTQGQICNSRISDQTSRETANEQVAEGAVDWA